MFVDDKTVSKPESQGGQPLVACRLCGTIVDQAHAVKREIEGPTGLDSVWVCQNCIHLGSEEATRKYVMKEKKTVGR